VLDGGVRAEPAGGRMPVHGVASAEDPAPAVLGGPGLVDLSGGCDLDLDLDVWVAVPGQVRLEQRVDGADPAHDTLDRQAEFLGDRGAGAVGADQVPGADGVLMAIEAVAQGGSDAGVVLDVAE